MPDSAKPLVISAPEPRTLELIFTPEALARFARKYRIVETTPTAIAALPADDACRGPLHHRPAAAVARRRSTRMPALRCIFNVETNLINNMPYEVLFERGIHVVTTGPVFAEPVAELGLAMALNLARDIVDADLAFRDGRELWGGDGNQTARLLVRRRDRHHRLRRSRPRAEPAAYRVSRARSASTIRGCRRRSWSTTASSRRASTRCWRAATSSSSSPR